MAKVTDERRKRGPKYDPRVTLRMKGEIQTNLNIPTALRDQFKALAEALAVPMKKRLAALLEADVKAAPLVPVYPARAGRKAAGKPVPMDYAAGARAGTSLSVAEDTWAAWRALCARNGWTVRHRMSGLVAADVAAGGLDLP